MNKNQEDILQPLMVKTMPDGAKQYYWLIQRSENREKEIADALVLANIYGRLKTSIMSTGKVVYQKKSKTMKNNYDFLMVVSGRVIKTLSRTLDISKTHIFMICETNFDLSRILPINIHAN